MVIIPLTPPCPRLTKFIQLVIIPCLELFRLAPSGPNSSQVIKIAVLSDGCHWFRWMPWTCELIGAGGLAQMCPWPPQAHDFLCFGQFHGTPESVDAESKLPHPIKMCGFCGSSVQCTSHAAIFLPYINIWLYIHIFDIHISGSVA